MLFKAAVEMIFRFLCDFWYGLDEPADAEPVLFAK